MCGICTAAALVGLFGLGFGSAQGQDVAESALMTSNSTIASQSAKAPAPTIAAPTSKASSPYLVARSGPTPEEVNRRDFEDNAGKDAGKLLLRSIPTGAEVFLNDRLVGRTPLLMLVAPGKYTIDMRGPRQQSGHSVVGLMPKQTQTVAIDLKQRYPTSISVR